MRHPVVVKCLDCGKMWFAQHTYFGAAFDKTDDETVRCYCHRGVEEKFGMIEDCPEGCLLVVGCYDLGLVPFGCC